MTEAESKKLINLGLLDYYDEKIKQWVLNAISGGSSKGLELTENFNVWELAEGTYFCNKPIICHYNTTDEITMSNINDSLQIFMSNEYKYYIHFQFSESEDSSIEYVLRYGKVSLKGEGEAPKIFSFNNIQQQLDDLKAKLAKIINDSELEII